VIRWCLEFSPEGIYLHSAQNFPVAKTSKAVRKAYTELPRMAKYSKYFASAPDWERYSNDPSRPELALRVEASKPAPMDVEAGRAAQAVDEAKWEAEHPPESYG
jgi:hypothetical protein